MLRRSAVALVAAALLITLPTAAQAAQPVASGGLLAAKWSASGEWLLYSQGSAPTGAAVYNSKLYLWRRGSRRPVGRGLAEGVSNDGRTVASQCAEYILCLKRIGQPVRRLSIRCPLSPSIVTVAGDLKSLIFECSSSSSAATHTLVRIGATATTIERLPGRSLTLRGLSTDGSTAVFEGSNRAIEVYRHGQLKTVPGISELGSVSSNGRFVIGSSPRRVVQTCPYEDPTKELGFEIGQPVIADLQSDRLQSVPAADLCFGQALAVSDDGRSVVYRSRIREGCSTCAALVLVNVSTGQTTTLASNPDLFYSNVQFADSMVSWVSGGFPQALFVSTPSGVTRASAAAIRPQSRLSPRLRQSP
jgi:hypothetical protein